MAAICRGFLPYYEEPRDNDEYRAIKINDELLRRIESLERKVDDLQNRNKKLENILKYSFVSFKFQGDNNVNGNNTSDYITRIRQLIS
jgi:hypothetical protein